MLLMDTGKLKCYIQNKHFATETAEATAHILTAPQTMMTQSFENGDTFIWILIKIVHYKKVKQVEIIYNFTGSLQSIYDQQHKISSNTHFANAMFYI